MAASQLPRDGAARPLAEINMIPLIDVMLVLLVIFIVTAPLLTGVVNVDLPRATGAHERLPPDPVQLAILAGGEVLWNGTRVTRDGLADRLGAVALANPQPELRVQADRLVPFERVAQVMADAARHGVTRVGFVTAPETESGP